MNDEGWGFPSGSRKAHYFTKDGRSLCLRWAFYNGPLERDDALSPDDCVACRKKLPDPQPAKEWGPDHPSYDEMGQ